MRILIVSPHGREREIMIQYLTREGHEVHGVADGRSALSNVFTQSPEITVIDWDLAAPTALELVKTWRTDEDETHAYTIALMGAASAATIAAAFAAGIDDVIRRPIVREELIGRVGALARIKRWAVRLLGVGVTSQMPSTQDISKLRAWNEAESDISHVLEAMFGRTVHTGPPARPEIKRAAEIPLSLATDGIDVRLTVALDADSLQSVGEMLLGAGATDEALGDVVREIANMAASGFKRAAAAEDVMLTTGLPVDVEAETALATIGATYRDFYARVGGSHATIRFRLSIKPRGLERLPPELLREGMIVVRDLRSADGVLLVKSGTRLTETTVARLATLLGGRLIEIANAA